MTNGIFAAALQAIRQAAARAVLQYHENAARKQTVQVGEPSLVAIPLGIRDHVRRMRGYAMVEGDCAP
jgi:hypothetical protein